MAIAFEQHETGDAVVLDGAIDISSAAELKTVLLQALSSATEVRVRLDQVTYLDVTAVQLLFAAGQQARRSGGSIEILGQVPAAVLSALADAGFHSLSASVQAG
jgi:anti-anti-sigma factor